MKISEMIQKLKAINEDYGDLDIYEYNDRATISPYEFSPKVNKIYSQKWEDVPHMRDELSNGNLNEQDNELHDVDLLKPIVIGVII